MIYGSRAKAGRWRLGHVSRSSDRGTTLRKGKGIGSRGRPENTPRSTIRGRRSRLFGQRARSSGSPAHGRTLSVFVFRMRGASAVLPRQDPPIPRIPVRIIHLQPEERIDCTQLRIPAPATARPTCCSSPPTDPFAPATAQHGNERRPDRRGDPADRMKWHIACSGTHEHSASVRPSRGRAECDAGVHPISASPVGGM